MYIKTDVYLQKISKFLIIFYKKFNVKNLFKLYLSNAEFKTVQKTLNKVS